MSNTPRILILCILAFTILSLLGGDTSAQVTEEWVERYDGPGAYQDFPVAIGLDAAGNVYVTGYGDADTSIVFNLDYSTLKYDNNGVLQWARGYNGPGNDEDNALAMVVDPAGNVYVTGFSNGAGTDRDIATVKYDTDGNERWVARYNGPGNARDEGNDIAVDSQGNVYVGGYSEDVGDNKDLVMIKYNAVGAEEWVKSYNGPGNSDDKALAITLGDNNYVYATGYSYGIATDRDYITIKYHTGGPMQWYARYNSPDSLDDRSYDIAVDGGGNVYVTGFCEYDETDYDFVTIKYNFAGNEQWATRYNRTGNQDKPSCIDLDGEGNIIVAGQSCLEYSTVKYSPNGEELWAASYGGPSSGTDIINDITIDVYNNVYVTGYSMGLQDYDITTLKYDQNGEEKWEMRYTYSPYSGDYGKSVTVDSEGNVYVTGSSTGSNQCYDYATIKYSQRQLDIDLTLTPYGIPIQIPSSGGSFDFNVTMTNNQANPVSAEIWVMVQLPDQSWFGPVLGPVNLTLSGGETITRDRTQDVPSAAPPGEYLYEGRIGQYPGEVWDYDHFGFEKLAGAGGGTIGEWLNSGAEFKSSRKLNTENNPEVCTLEDSFPNPFDPATNIRFTLSRSSEIRLTIYDVRGCEITALVDGWRDAGVHEVTFDGSGLASGIYLCSLKSAGFTAYQKILLVK
jgi:uncharacterized delta-60 repeat protein